MKQILCSLAVLALAFHVSCSQQPSEKKDKIVGGRCEGCEGIFEYGDEVLKWTDTLPDYDEKGPKLEITGTIYLPDGKTPAKDVILYVYHTNQEGIYPIDENATGWGKRHGYIRGWIKTDATGRYRFLTLRPGAYPGRQNPQHIHPIIKEEGKTPYWIDDYLFSDDPILKAKGIDDRQNRGGSGILTCTTMPDGTLVATRDIVLGLNVPGY